MRRLPAIAILLILPVGFLFSAPIIAPSIGVQADIALEQDAIWYFKVQAPVMWTDLGAVGVSLVPGFSFNSEDFHGFLCVEGLLPLELGRGEETRLLLHSGVGIGGYRHGGESEILPLVTGGASLMAHRAYVRLSAEAMVMTKYYRDIDTYVSLMGGYSFGS